MTGGGGKALLLLVLAAGVAGATAVPAATQGYLATPTPADSADWAPPPPAAGSAAAARDEAGAAAALPMRGTPRFDLATRDAGLRHGGLLRAFDCTLDIATGDQATPRTSALVNRLIDDFGRAPALIKEKFARPRPFMVNGAPTCTPEDEAMLRTSGSYPSGHSAAGFGVALVLAQLLPERASALMARGRSFGDSRRLCNVHWLSDIEEGQMIAAATFARLQSEPAFRRDMQRAGAELRKARGKAPGCTAEREALGLTDRTTAAGVSRR